MILGRIAEAAFIPVAAGLVAASSYGLVERALPVTLGMQAVPVAYDGETFTARVEGYKVKNCFVVAGSFIGWQKIGRVWSETAISFPDDQSPNSSNPGQWEKQSFGLFKWQIDPRASEVKVTLTHRCGDGLSITTVGPFEILTAV